MNCRLGKSFVNKLRSLCVNAAVYHMWKARNQFKCTDRLYLVLVLLYVHEMGSELLPPTVIVLKRLGRDLHLVVIASYIASAVLNVQLAATLSRKP
ncbi:hypothetical protein LIER_13872 [Lithospermum erythrorhizon]|uniref:Uncharacterized protein n=1 Tax=Lithospermum erythrorhizon TaxID=34254 RepID=A0AAV3PYZ1_LITER